MSSNSLSALAYLFPAILSPAIAIASITLSPSLPAYGQQPARTCTQAKASAQRRLTALRNLTVRTQTRSIASDYPDHPVGRPNSHGLIMRGRAAESVLQSPQMMTAIATDIITACETVSMVTFSLDGSGWFLNIGLLPGGTIGGFRCAEEVGVQPGSGVDRLSWGLQYCSI